MASFDFAGLPKAWGGGIQPRILGRATTSGGLGHATWKEEEILDRERAAQEVALENSPQYQEMLARKKQEEERLELIKREKQKEDYAKWEKEQILKSVSDSKFRDSIVSGEKNGYEALAEQSKRAALEALKRGQVVPANEFFDAAAQYESKALSYKAQERTMLDKKKEDASELLGSVNDPVSWALAKPQLAKAGVDIPAQFQSWGPETAKWAQSLHSQSKVGMESDKLQYRYDALKSREAETQAKREADEAKLQQKRASDALKQNLVAVEKVPSGKKLEETVFELAGNEKFEDLAPEVQDAAAKELDLVAKYLMKLDPSLPPLVARDKAKADIYSRIDAEGNFTPFVAEKAKAAGPATGKAPAAALDYLKAHPETKDKFKARFGYLPEGY